MSGSRLYARLSVALALLLVLCTHGRSLEVPGPSWADWPTPQEPEHSSSRRTLLGSQGEPQGTFEVIENCQPPAQCAACTGRAAHRRAAVRGGRRAALHGSPTGDPLSSTRGPPHLQVDITCDQQGPTTSSPVPLWTVAFGRPLQQANPLALFRVAGVYRWVAAAASGQCRPAREQPAVAAPAAATPCRGGTSNRRCCCCFNRCAVAALPVLSLPHNTQTGLMWCISSSRACCTC